jgi:hypothetical protein
MSKLSVDKILASLKENWMAPLNGDKRKRIPQGYCATFGKNNDWTHDANPGDFPPDILYNDLLEYCLRMEFEEKFKKQQEEIDILKKALADTLAALAAK